MALTEIIIRTILQTMTFQELELTLPKKEKDQNVMHQIGQPSIGNPSSVMVEKLRTLEKDSEKDKSLDLMSLPLEADNHSTVSILLCHNLEKVIKPLFTAHHTTLMEVPTPFPHLAISSFL
jgi:hypothetical protein